MSMIPEIKCRRCGETFSSMRSRCPNCGTRRVAQSGRAPGTTPGMVKGTAAYERAETNTKWQMIFGLILVVAVILAVIVMVSTTLDGVDNVGSKVTPPMAAPSGGVPAIEAPPTPTPSPPPTVERVVIKYYENELEDFTIGATDPPLPITAAIYPLTIENVTVNWSVGDDELLSVTPTSEDGRNVEVVVLNAPTQLRRITMTAECLGIEKTIMVSVTP